MNNEIVKNFEEYNFHDCTIELVQIEPSTSYGTKTASITVKLSETENQLVEIEFKDCRNISFSCDFDILKDNSGSGNTSHSGILSSRDGLIDLIKKIETRSNIEYQNIESPIDKKLKIIDELTCFELYFFGGTLKVIANGFEVSNSK